MRLPNTGISCVRERNLSHAESDRFLDQALIRGAIGPILYAPNPGCGSRLASRRGGLAQESQALCHQITTLDRGKLGAVLVSLMPSQMGEVDQGIKISIDLP